MFHGFGITSKARRVLSIARQFAVKSVHRCGFATRGQVNIVSNSLAELKSQCADIGWAMNRLQTNDSAAEPNQHLDSLADLNRRLTQLVGWLAQEPWSVHLAAGVDGPLVSIVMPVRNRADCVGRAIESVARQTYGRWELLVADDGSTDTTREIVSNYLCDKRIRLLCGPALGVSAARNLALRQAQGELIAYLDSDNLMARDYLAALVAAFDEHPEASAVYAAQAVLDENAAPHLIRFQPFKRDELERENFIDLNAFAHRRSAADRYGLFDPTIARLGDWDLILRYTADQPPVAIPALSGSYSVHRNDRISVREPVGQCFHRIRRHWDATVPPGLRILYMVWHWPQLTESYVRWEVDYMRQRGFDVLIWAETDRVASWFEHDAPVTYDPLPEVIDRFRPDLAHAYWLHEGLNHIEPLARRNVPVTVRGHGFECCHERIAQLQAHPSVRAIYLHPHWPPKLANKDKIRSAPSGYCPEVYYPEPKNRRRVFRTAAGLPDKELELFIDLAKRCPEFEFVLAVAPSVKFEDYLTKLVEYNRSLGSPARLIVNVPHETVAQWMRPAGIYLHTIRSTASIGGPISIAEAMGCGCHVVARQVSALMEYIGDAGQYYTDIDSAERLLRETLRWSDADWQDAQRRSIDTALLRHTNVVAFGEIVRDWLRIIGNCTSSKFTIPMRQAA